MGKFAYADGILYSHETRRAYDLSTADEYPTSPYPVAGLEQYLQRLGDSHVSVDGHEGRVGRFVISFVDDPVTVLICPYWNLLTLSQWQRKFL